MNCLFLITGFKLLKLLSVVCGFGTQTYVCKNYIQNICSVVVIARYLVCTLCSLNWLILYFSCSGSVLFGSNFVSHGLFCQWNWRCSFAGEILNKNINKPSTYAFRHLLTKVHSLLKDTVRANQPTKFFCCSLTGCLTLIVSLICT